MKLSYTHHSSPSSLSVVFLHGSNQSKETFEYQLDSQKLAAWDLWAIDLPGHGESPALDHFSMNTMAQALKDFIDSLHLKNIILVGHSLGGHLALACHALGLELKGLVLMSVPPASKPINMSEMFKEGPSALLYKINLSLEEQTQIALSQYSSPRDISQDLKSLATVSNAFRKDLPQSLMLGEHIDEKKHIQTLKIPMLIAAANSDAFVQNETILLNHPQQAIVKSYPTGHNIHRESPQTYNEDLSCFIEDIARGLK